MAPAFASQRRRTSLSPRPTRLAMADASPKGKVGYGCRFCQSKQLATSESKLNLMMRYFIEFCMSPRYFIA
jgi:hypothetical protein